MIVTWTKTVLVLALGLVRAASGRLAALIDSEKIGSWAFDLVDLAVRLGGTRRGTA